MPKIEINVRFPSPDILNELHDEIAGWPQTLYRVLAANHTLAVTPGAVTLDPSLQGCYGVIDVRHGPTRPSTPPRGPRSPRLTRPLDGPDRLLDRRHADDK